MAGTDEPDGQLGDPERAHLDEAAAAHGIDTDGLGIERVSVDVAGMRLRALVYSHEDGDGHPPVALLHGGKQNAHTWDLTVAAARMNAIALDLPGHGCSDWLEDHDYSPRRLGAPVTAALQVLCPEVEVLVGMSLGGMVAVLAAATLPQLRHLVTVDVSPGSVLPPANNHAVLAALAPAPLEDLMAAVAGSSTRRQQGLRHAVWHNTRGPGRERCWRWDPDMHVGSFLDLWPDYLALAPRMTAVIAGRYSYVPAGDQARIEALLGGRVQRIVEASHSVQNTQPNELAAVLRGLLAQ